MHFAKEEVDHDGEDPQEEIVDELVHGRQRLLRDLLCAFRRHRVFLCDSCGVVVFIFAVRQLASRKVISVAAPDVEPFLRD